MSSMEFLVFQLQAPLSSWGDAAVGEYRASLDHPGESALLGLLGAALGIRRDDEPAQAALRERVAFAVGVQSTGQLLRDYHTAQVPGRAALKGRPQSTRKQELAVPKADLGTILSTRDYRQGAACLVAVRALDDAPLALEALRQALQRPRFVLYLGRKACPPSAPLHPMVVSADNAVAAFDAYGAALEALQRAHAQGPAPIAKLVRVAWGDGMADTVGAVPDLSAPRKDRVIRRRTWQFGDRMEYVKLMPAGTQET